MKRVYDLANLTLCLLIGVLVYRAYPRLPERLPLHFNMTGQPDRWSGRGGLVVLFLMPLVLTAVFYLMAYLVPRLGAGARTVNIPHKEEFLRLPAEKRAVFWALFREFFAGFAAATNLIFYIFIRGTIDVALGAKSLLPFKAGLPAFVLLGLLMAFYLWRLMTLPGKLIRGEL